MTKPAALHIRENLRKDSAILCGGGRALDLDSLPSVALTKWKASKRDCGRCVRVVKARKG